MRRTLRLLLFTAAVSVAGASSAQACGYTVRAAPHGRRPPGHRNAVVIGDSTLVFAAPLLAHRGLRADAMECRQFSQGLAMLGGHLPHLVVLALGANGPVGTGQIGAALRRVGRHRVLGLVTPRNLASSAGAMRWMAARHPQRILLMDWRSYSAGQGSWFAGDGLHVNYAGAAAYAAFIAARAAGVIAPPRLTGLHSGRVQRRCGTVRRGRHRLEVAIVRGARRTNCRNVRALARRPPLTVGGRWRWYDWRPQRRSPWSDVYVRGAGHGRIAVTRPVS
jgi:hypothetical protein